MKLALEPHIRFSRILLFPLAMVIYDFSAYLTTDLIQPGIIHIIREFEADVALAPASVSLYLAGGLALQWLLGPLSDRIGRRPVLLTGAIIFALACFSMIFVTSIDQYLIARFIQGTSICFISTVGYVSIQEAFDEKESIRIMARAWSVWKAIRWPPAWKITSSVQSSCRRALLSAPANMKVSRWRAGCCCR